MCPPRALEVRTAIATVLWYRVGEPFRHDVVVADPDSDDGKGARDDETVHDHGSPNTRFATLHRRERAQEEYSVQSAHRCPCLVMTRFLFAVLPYPGDNFAVLFNYHSFLCTVHITGFTSHIKLTI